MQHNTSQYEGGAFWSGVWTFLKRHGIDWLCANVYGPACIKHLKSALHMERNTVLRKGKTDIWATLYRLVMRG